PRDPYSTHRLMAPGMFERRFHVGRSRCMRGKEDDYPLSIFHLLAHIGVFADLSRSHQLETSIMEHGPELGDQLASRLCFRIGVGGGEKDKTRGVLIGRT